MASPRKLIVRTSDGTTSGIPKAVRDKMQALAGSSPPHTELRSIKSEEKHLVHYERRIKSIDKGVKLLLKSNPGYQKLPPEEQKKIMQNFNTRREALLKRLQNEDLRHANEKEEKLRVLGEQEAKKTDYSADEVREKKFREIEADLGSTEPYLQILSDYVLLVEEDLKKLNLIPEKEVREALGRAEEYAILADGRETLCTVTQRTGKNQDRWIIQMEVPQDPLSEEAKQEFLRIITTIKSGGNQETLPQWYKIMPQSEKELFFHTFRKAKNTADIGRKIQSISSKHRSIPGLANYSKHIFVVMKSDGTVVTQDQRDRSSHISSRDVFESGKKLGQDVTQLAEQMTEQNVEQVINTRLESQVASLVAARKKQGLSNDTVITVPVLMQTLITPVVPEMFRPDKTLHNNKNAVIAKLKQAEKSKTRTVTLPDGTKVKVKIEFISTNHPLNPWRYASFVATAQEKKYDIDENAEVTAGKENDESIKKLILLLKKYHSQSYDLKILAVREALINAFKSSRKIQDRELYLSALEELAVGLMHGIPYGSCVSGKDRKGIETIYTDAMRWYLDEYGTIPPSYETPPSKARQEFVRMFTDLYVTRHLHENAGQNAPGADAIKDPMGYLPDDMLDSIIIATNNKNIHQQSDAIASLNENDKLKNKLSSTALEEDHSHVSESMELNRKRKTEKPFLEELEEKPKMEKSSSATLLHTFFGGSKRALENRRATSVISEEERQLILEIKSILPEKTSFRNATGINKLITLFKKERDNVTLQQLGKICDERLSITMEKRSVFDNDIYAVISDLSKDHTDAATLARWKVIRERHTSDAKLSATSAQQTPSTTHKPPKLST